MHLKVLKNKVTGQISINIPKSVAELYKIDSTMKISLEPKSRNEFILRIEK